MIGMSGKFLPSTVCGATGNAQPCGYKEEWGAVDQFVWLAIRSMAGFHCCCCPRTKASVSAAVITRG